MIYPDEVIDENVRASLTPDPDEDELDENVDDLDDEEYEEEDLTVYDDEDEDLTDEEEPVIEEDFSTDSDIVIGDDELDEIEQLDTRENGIMKPYPTHEMYGDNTLTNTN